MGLQKQPLALDCHNQILCRHRQLMSTDAVASGHTLMNPFPNLKLAAEDKQVIVDSIDLVLQHALAQYEAHLVDSRGVVAESQWKLVMSRDSFVVYRKRNTSPRASDSAKLHKMLAIGTVASSVDDLLYGFVNPRGDSAAAYSAFLFKESVLGFAVLAPIVLPSRSEPERSVMLKWDAHGSMSATLNRVTTPRDFVTAEATGSTINSLGERIGYHIIHSVDVDGAPELVEPHLIRGSKYFTYLYRQMPNNEVEVYVSGHVDPKGKIPTGVAVRATAMGILGAVDRTIKFAELKKRTWLYRHHRVVASEFVGSPDVCCVCGRSVKGVFHSSKECAVCGRAACSSCTKPNKVIISDATAPNGITLQKLPFCAQCLRRAHDLNAWDLAVSEAESQAKGETSATSTVSSHSSS